MTTALLIIGIWLTAIALFIFLLAGFGRHNIALTDSAFTGRTQSDDTAGPVHGASASVADDVPPRTSLVSPVLPTLSSSDRPHGETAAAGAPTPSALQATPPTGPVRFSHNVRVLGPVES